VNESHANESPANASPGKIETGLFAVGFAMASLVLLALLWSGRAAYEDMARMNGVDRVTFIAEMPGGGTYTMDRNGLVAMHEQWSRYVTGGAADPPRFAPPLFTEDEYSHMADVRGVFDSVKILIPAGMFVMALRMQRARARGVASLLRLVRSGAIAALVAVAVVGIVAAVAFDAAFLLFHQVFFPQGNFLFDPATSNLLRLYPDWYWQGITFRIGLSFIGLAAAVAVAAAVGLRRALH
jgi:integral membrane protein (TIGR01906 family)